MGDIIQKHAQAHGFSVVRSYCGHGIHRSDNFNIPTDPMSSANNNCIPFADGLFCYVVFYEAASFFQLQVLWK